MDGIKGGYLSGEYPYEMGDINKELITKYIKKAYFQFYLRPSKIFEMVRISLSVGEIKWNLNSGVGLLKGIFAKT